MKTLTPIFVFCLIFFSTFNPIIGQIIDEELALPPEAVEVEMDPPSSNSTSPSTTQAPKNAWRGKQNGRYGFYTSKAWVIPGMYDELPVKYSDFMIAKKGKKYGIINKLNQELIPFEYDKIYQIYENYREKKLSNYYLIQKKETAGIIDHKGKIVIPATYKSFTRLTFDVYAVGKADGTFGLLSIDGTEIHPFLFESAPVKGIGDTYIVKKNAKTGTIDKQGKMVLPFEYNAIVFNSSYDGKTGNLYIATKDSGTGLIDKNGKVVLPLQYDQIKGSLYNQFLSVSKDQKYGLSNRAGKLLVPVAFDNVRQYKDNFFMVQNNELYGLIDRNGKEIFPPTYKRMERESKRYFTVKKDGFLRGAVDTLGHLILKCNYSKIRYGVDKLIFASDRNTPLMAVYNEKGEQLKPATYYRAERAYNYTLVTKQKSGKYALFDNATTTELTPFIYTRIKVRQDRKNEGQLIIKAERDGTQVQLTADGKEAGAPTVSRSQRNNQRLQARERQAAKEMNGQWFGILDIDNDSYLQEFTFYAAKQGIRKVFYLEKGKECFIEQSFNLISSDAKNYYIKPTNSPNSRNCKHPLPKALQNKNPFTSKLKSITISLASQHTETLISGLTKSTLTTSSQGSKGYFETLRNVKKLNISAKKLLQKIETKPGGPSNPSIVIKPENNEVILYSFGSPRNIAFVEFKGDQAILKTEYWETGSNYFLAGVWKNVTYIDKNGQEKTGDLDLCFNATKTQFYWLRETIK